VKLIFRRYATSFAAGGISQGFKKLINHKWTAYNKSTYKIGSFPPALLPKRLEPAFLFAKLALYTERMYIFHTKTIKEKKSKSNENSREARLQISQQKS